MKRLRRRSSNLLGRRQPTPRGWDGEYSIMTCSCGMQGFSSSLPALSPSVHEPIAWRHKRVDRTCGRGRKIGQQTSHKTSVQWRLPLRAAEIANALRTPWRCACASRPRGSQHPSANGIALYKARQKSRKPVTICHHLVQRFFRAIWPTFSFQPGDSGSGVQDPPRSDQYFNSLALPLAASCTRSRAGCKNCPSEAFWIRAASAASHF